MGVGDGHLSTSVIPALSRAPCGCYAWARKLSRATACSFSKAWKLSPSGPRGLCDPSLGILLELKEKVCSSLLELESRKALQLSSVHKKRCQRKSTRTTLQFLLGVGPNQPCCGLPGSGLIYSSFFPLLLQVVRNPPQKLDSHEMRWGFEQFHQIFLSLLAHKSLIDTLFIYLTLGGSKQVTSSQEIPTLLWGWKLKCQKYAKNA